MKRLSLISDARVGAREILARYPVKSIFEGETFDAVALFCSCGASSSSRSILEIAIESFLVQVRMIVRRIWISGRIFKENFHWESGRDRGRYHFSRQIPRPRGTSTIPWERSGENRGDLGEPVEETSLNGVSTARGRQL